MSCPLIPRQGFNAHGLKRGRSSGGVYEHIYKENVLGKQGFGTHHVVLACELILTETPASLPTQQHEDYAWKMEREVLDWPAVHENTNPGERKNRPPPLDHTHAEVGPATIS